MTGPGRPSTGVRVDVRIPTERLAIIDAIAKHYDCSRADLIRHLLQYATNSDSRMVPQALLTEVRNLERD